MASVSRFGYEVFLKTDDFVRGAETIVSQVQRIQKAGGRVPKGLLDATKQFNDQTAAVGILRKQIEDLVRVRQKLDALGKKSSSSLVGQHPDAKQALESLRQNRAISEREVKQFRTSSIDKAIGPENERGGPLVAQFDAAKEAADKLAVSVVDMSAATGVGFDTAAEAVGRFANELRQVQRALGGGLEDRFRKGSVDAINDEIFALEAQKTALDKSIREQRNERTQKVRTQVGPIEDQANAARARAVVLEGQIRDASLAAADAAAKKLPIEQQLAQIEELRLRHKREINNAQGLDDRAKKINDGTINDRGLAGLTEAIDTIDSRIANLKQSMRQAFDPDAIAKLHPELQKEIEELERLRDAAFDLNKAPEERIQSMKEASALSSRLEGKIDQARGGLIGDNTRIPEKDFNRLLQNHVPGINRLFTNVSQDLSRRFVATLQFAISGALIFGVQKFVREFVQSAIEVERAFKDIESALEFDIKAGRGTEEFRLEVENVRRQVLLLAEEFNVLPTEANKAAFVMVSRFKDTGNAMIALRAHMLATKVSTIDQSETLRALTAVAEGFSGAIFESNNLLTLNERLLQRETIAAGLYGRALDLAVQIQQKFGVEVEDTLEGGARSTEVFRQMGFTMEETFAIVAATSRELGQTGQQAAERLNRSLGQLTDPKIRDALLNLSGVTSEFTLGISDFESGATAWHKIVDEFERLEKVDPSAARQILQIVGQRRELEAVAAALGTADLQSAIIAGADTATGSAESRFGFLKVTVDEILKSISAGLQELSQNFERLGGLNALKLLLGAFEKFVLLLNDALKFLIDIRDFIDKVLPGSFGTLLFQASAFTLALSGALRVSLEIVKVFKQLAGAKALGFLTRFLALGGGVSLFGQGGILNLREGFKAGRGEGLGRLGSAKVAGQIVGGRVAGAAGATASKVVAATTAMLANVPVWGWIAAGVVAATFALWKFKKASDALAAAVITNAHNSSNAIIQAKRDALRDDLSPSETKLSVAQAELQSKRENLQTAVDGGGLSGFVRDIFRTAGGRNLRSSGTGIKPAEGTKKFVEQEIIKLVQEVLELTANDLIATINNPKILTDAKGGEITDDQKRAITSAIGQNVTGGQVNAATEAQAILTSRLNEAIQLSFSNVPEDRAKAQTLIEGVVGDWDAVLKILGKLPSDLTLSVEQLSEQLAGLDTQKALGRVSQAQISFQQNAAVGTFKEAAAEFRVIGDEKGAVDAERKADDALLASLESKRVELGDYVRNGSRFRGEEESLAFEIRATADFIEENSDQFAAGALIQEQEHLADLIKQQADDYRAAGLEAKATAVSLARNFEARRTALKEQIAAIRFAASRSQNDQKAMRALIDSADALQLALIREEEDQATRYAQYLFLVRRPSQDPIAAIQAQIIGFNRTLNDADSSSADKGDAWLALRNATAQIAQLELARLTSMVLAGVSVRDALSNQLVQLSFLRQQAALIKIQYGASTQAYFDAGRAIKEAEASLIDYVLAAESVGRQLSSSFDVTDPLAAANEAYITAARALQVVGLGDAEREAAELAFKNAEAARLGASFNAGMFDLKFAFEQGTLGQNAYIESLRGMLAAVDTTTHQGKELWLQINSLIEGLTDDLSGAAFNIPGQIRIPTLFEVRRAVQAESLGVNYVDNRQQDIIVNVSDSMSLEAVMDAISGAFEVQDARFAPGGAGITLGAP